MIPVSDEYKENIKKKVREIDGFVELIIDGGYFSAKKEQDATIKITSNNIASIVDLNTVSDIEPIMNKYASFEQDRFILDGSMILANKNNENINTGYISKNVGNTGSFEISSDAVSYMLLRTKKSKNITIYFEEGYATDFTVEVDAYYLSEKIVTYTYNITNNEKEIYTLYGNNIEDTIIANNISYEFKCILRVKVNVTGWSEQNRRVRIKHIFPGERILFKDKDLIEMNFVEQTSINNFEMPGNECNVLLNNYARKFNLLDNNSILNRLTKKSRLRLFTGLSINGNYEYIDLGSYEYASYKENDNKTITLYGIGIMQKEETTSVGLSSSSGNITVQEAYNLMGVKNLNDIYYNGNVEINRTNANNEREQMQAMAIFSGNFIKESKITNLLFLENELIIKKISLEPLDNIDLNIQLKQPKITKYNKTKYIKMKNYQIGTLDNTEKILVDNYHINTSNATANSSHYTYIYMNTTNPVDMSSIKVYMKNPEGTETQILDFEHHTSPNPWITIYNSYYVPYIGIDYFNIYEDGINIKVVGKEYSQSVVETIIENTNIDNGETVEYNNNYLVNPFDKQRVARYLFNNEMDYIFEIEFNGDPSLEAGDTITFETTDGNMLGIIEKIELKYNGGLNEIISGVCKNVL